MLSFLLSQFSLTVALILSFAGTRLDAKSVIVDDADTTKITYSSGWNIGNDCSKCSANPIKSQAFEETWHE
jgi:phosphatidylserine/phosphatidylglycerophosphate/cardiolipin synthase-like enzyme